MPKEQQAQPGEPHVAPELHVTLLAGHLGELIHRSSILIFCAYATDALLNMPALYLRARLKYLTMSKLSTVRRGKGRSSHQSSRAGDRQHRCAEPAAPHPG